MVPDPVAARVEPVPTTIAAVVLVAEERPEKGMAVATAVTVQVEPRVQVWPFTVVAALARLALGIPVGRSPVVRAT